MKKEETGALKGIAALLVVFHHCFLFTPLFIEGFLKNPELNGQFARSGRICVAICAFLSGYGLFHSLLRSEGYAKEYANVGRRIVNLYGRYWYVLVITVIVEILIFGRQMPVSELPGNITAFNPTYNTTWWYVREYVYMLLLAPLIKAILQGDKTKRFVAVGVLAVAVLIFGVLFLIPGGREMILKIMEYVQVTLLVIFFEGYLTAYLQNRLKDKISRKELRVPVKTVIGIIILAVSYFARFMLSSDAGDSKPDIILIPFILFGAVLTLRGITVLAKGLRFIGRYLLYIWFIHGLVWRESTEFLVSNTNPVIYFCVIFILSLLLAILLDRIEKIAVSCVKKCANK